MSGHSLKIIIFLLFTNAIFMIGWKSAEKSYPQQALAPKIAADSTYNAYISNIYHQIHLDSTSLDETVFEKALTGFYNLKYAGLLQEKSILTIADFDQESTRKRLYIIDLDKKMLLLNTWVAHGEKSGSDKAYAFSNEPNSNKSSLGFYVTGETYYGKHGRSLKLDGMDAGYNDRARERAIVLHGATYVGEQSIRQLGRLGRSQGCPAVPAALSNSIINTISNHTVLFINNSEQPYHSLFLNEQLAATMVHQEQQVFAAQTD